MRSARSVFPALLLGVVLVTGGCAGLLGPDRPPSDQRAVETVAQSQAAIDAIESYRFTLDGHVEARGEDDQISIDVTSVGAVDVTSRRLNVTTRARNATRETYITGYTSYRECSHPTMEWGKTNLSKDQRWFNYTPVGEQLALLDRTDVYWQGTETLNGTEAAVIVAYPTKKELRSTAPRRGTDPTNLDGVGVENVTVTVWIDTDTGRMLKAQREVRVEQDGATATATVTFQFSDYDEPVAITTPAIEDESAWNTGCPGE